MIIESADAPLLQLILRDRLTTHRAGEPLGRLGDGSATEVAARHAPPVGLVTPNNVTVT
jgi:hypothetical protein